MNINNKKLLAVVTLSLLLHLTTWTWLDLGDKPFLPASSVYCLNDEEFIKLGCDPKIHLKMLDDVDFILGGVFPTSHLLEGRQV